MLFLGLDALRGVSEELLCEENEKLRLLFHYFSLSLTRVKQNGSHVRGFYLR